MRKALIAVGLVTLLGGCSFFGSPVKTGVINRRYMTLDSSVEANDSQAPVRVLMRTALTTPVPDTGRSVFNLDGRGQAALLSKITKPEDVAALLNAKYQVTVDDGTAIDQTKPKISVVLTVQLKEYYSGLPGKFSLADRVEFLRVRFALDSASRELARFASWDKVATQYGQINLGVVGFGDTRSLTISPSIPVFNGATGQLLTGGSYVGSTTGQESDTLQQRLTTLNGVLQDGEFILEEHGNAKMPVDGNTSLNVVMDYFNKDGLGYFIIDGLREKEQYASPSKLHPKAGTLQFPKTGDLFGTLTADYAVRHIKHGAETYTEGDDIVNYIHGRITRKHVRLLLNRQVETNFFGLVLHDSLQIHIQDTLTHGQELYRPLYFRSFKEASDFREWLQDQLPKYKEKGKSLKVGGFELFYERQDTGHGGGMVRQVLTNTSDISTLQVTIYTAPQQPAPKNLWRRMKMINHRIARRMLF